MGWQRHPQKTIKFEIVICKTWEGRGHNFDHKLVDYHRGDYETERYECWYCNGTGRMRRTTTVEEIAYEDKSRASTPSSTDDKQS